MWKLLLLAAAGALDTLARYGLNGVISSRVATFSFGTMIVNITGCFVIGVLAAISGPATGRAWLKSETRDGEWLFVTLNVVGSNVLGLPAIYGGWVCGRGITFR